MNPRIGIGMQQARSWWSGGNRRGGAKPRGRNTRNRWYLFCRSSGRKTACGSGRSPVCPMEGNAGGASARYRFTAVSVSTRRTNPKGVRPGTARAKRALWTRAKITKGVSVLSARRIGTPQAREPWTSAGNGEGDEGGRKDQRPAAPCGGEQEVSQKPTSPRTL